jgi:hypothetical protein
MGRNQIDRVATGQAEAPKLQRPNKFIKGSCMPRSRSNFSWINLGKESEGVFGFVIGTFRFCTHGGTYQAWFKIVFGNFLDVALVIWQVVWTEALLVVGS